MEMGHVSVDTDRLSLRRPHIDDVDALFAIFSDPRVWTHYPSGRATERAQTVQIVEHWDAGWNRDGLGMWTVRRRDDAEIIGYGGCSVSRTMWNLGYRLTPAAQGQGLATELSRAAITHARAVDPDRR